MDEAPSETLELLLEVGQLLSSKLEVGELLTTILGLSSRVVGAQSASLLLVDEKTQELYFDVALGLGEEAAKVRLKPGQGIAGAVALSRRPEIINDARADPRWSPAMDKQSGFTTRSILAVPLLIKGRLLGVLEAINKTDGDFTGANLKTFEAFASQAAIAIENARLFSSLREERFRLQTVFAQMAEGAVLVDDKGTAILSNEAARKQLNVDSPFFSLSGALSGMTVSPPLDRLFASREATQKFEAVREKPKKLVLAGEATLIQLGAGQREAASGGGRPLDNPGWLCVFRDVTEERVKETLKRTFLSLISHKLKTPLASIIGYSDILMSDFEGKPGSEDSLKCVHAISVQGNKLSNLVTTLLNYTTLEDSTAAPSAPCALDEIIAGAISASQKFLTDAKGSVSYAPCGLAVVGDKNQLQDLFKNLIENAVKFDATPQRQAVVTASAQGAMARVSVADRGPGIPPEDQEKVFSQFHQIEASFTGQMEGWGLGLPFVKKVAERHGGTVVLKSKLGEGTTVDVLLPLQGRG